MDETMKDLNKIIEMAETKIPPRFSRLSEKIKAFGRGEGEITEFDLIGLNQEELAFVFGFCNGVTFTAKELGDRIEKRLNG